MDESGTEFRVRRKRPVRLALAAAFVIAGITVLGYLMRDYLIGEPGNPALTGEDTLVVDEGESAWTIAHALDKLGLITTPGAFVGYLKLRGLTDELQAGTYTLPRAASVPAIVDRLRTGHVAHSAFTIPEGWTAERIAARIEQRDICDSAEFVETVRSGQVARELGFGELPALDGLLFPETYTMPLNTPAREVVAGLVDQFRRRMGREWIERARGDEYGLRGVLTLASIVEAEIDIVEEAEDVAAVYRNRLARGMKLEADPTVQFALPDGPRRLLLEDLEIDSPYNTYRVHGLPPGPINNPGEHALRAAVESPEAPWLYMVARGDGSHTFSKTYADHLRAKARFDAHRREVARQRRHGGG